MILSEIFLSDVLINFAAGIGIAIPLLYLNVRVARPLGLIDWPKARGVTEHQVPIVGLSLVLLTLGALLLFGEKYGVSSWFICTAAVIAVMGVIDDRRPLAAMDKIFFQVICAVVVVSMDPNVRAAITEPFGMSGAVLAILFIVGLTNAVNFIDGIDGLAGLVLFAGFSGLLLYSSAYRNFSTYSWVTSFMMGMLIPFFYLNVFRRKGFLGNTGSYFFSFVSAVMHLSLPIEAGSISGRLAVSSLCFIVPIADATMVILVRLSSLRSPFRADKGHLHHRLVQSSIPLRTILGNFAIISGMSVITGGFLIRYPESRMGYFPMFLCIGSILITSLMILLVEQASRMRIYGYFKRLDVGDPIYYLRYKVANKNGDKLQNWQLKRLEALISSEIRVTDLCVAEAPDQLFLTLRTLPEPLKGISARLEAVIQAEKNLTATILENGEFKKSPASSSQSSRSRIAS